MTVEDEVAADEEYHARVAEYDENDHSYPPEYDLIDWDNYMS